MDDVFKTDAESAHLSAWQHDNVIHARLVHLVMRMYDTWQSTLHVAVETDLSWWPGQEDQPPSFSLIHVLFALS